MRPDEKVTQSESSDKKHKCLYCSTEFTRHHNLQSHLLTHHQEKPYRCQECHSRFYRAFDLKRHLQLHVEELPHVCAKCNWRFTNRNDLAHHNKGNGGCAESRSSAGSIGGDGGEGPVKGTPYTSNDASHELQHTDEGFEIASKHGLNKPSSKPYESQSTSREYEAWSSSSDSLSELDSMKSDIESQAHKRHLWCIELLEDYVSNLMDLLPTIQACCHMERIPSSEESEAKQHQIPQSTPAAAPYVVLIQDKFPSIDSNLARRLGEATWQRVCRRLDLLRHAEDLPLKGKNRLSPEVEDDDKEEVEEEEGYPSQIIPISDILDSGLGTSLPTASRHAATVSSHASFISTESAANRGALRVPSIPAGAFFGLHFRCQFCQLSVKVRNRIEWKYV
jgi:hypothetical protein